MSLENPTPRTSFLRDTTLAMLIVAFFLFCLYRAAHAQTVDPIPVRVVISWQNATTFADGTPLPTTGPAALTRTYLYRSNAPILNAAILTPIADVPATQLTYTDDTTAPPGGKLYYRLKHANLGGLSAFSNESFKTVTVPIPKEPGNVATVITIIIAQ